MRRPYPQPTRIGRRLTLRVGGLGIVLRMVRWRGLRHLASGPLPVTRCDWVDHLLSAESPVKKPAKNEEGHVPRLPHAQPGQVAAAKWPHLSEWFTASEYDDQTPRKGGCLILSAENSTFRALLKEPTSGLLLRCECKTLDLLWATLEGLLALTPVPWEPDPRAEVPRPRGRKGGA